MNWTKEDLFERNPVIFSMLLRIDAEDKLYEEIIDYTKLIESKEGKMITATHASQDKTDT